MVPENIRIKFKKTGRLKYISHLDLCRTMCPAMIRAKIPLWYTEGFNPHPTMMFAQPLPLFVESECEFLDIKITEPVSHEELKARLRSAFTEELYVIDVYNPEADEELAAGDVEANVEEPTSINDGGMDLSENEVDASNFEDDFEDDEFEDDED